MWRILLSVIAIGVVVGGVWFINTSPRGGEPTSASSGQLNASSTLVDFGDIDQGNGVVSAVVEIENTGDDDLTIHRVSTSCGCTTAQMDTSALAPNETREMTITFDPMVHPDQSGPITRVVYIQSSDPDTPEVEIDVVGNVIPADDL